MLTYENVEELVTLVNEELQFAAHGLKDRRLDTIDAKMKDITNRLARPSSARIKESGIDNAQGGEYTIASIYIVSLRRFFETCRVFNTK